MRRIPHQMLSYPIQLSRPLRTYDGIESVEQMDPTGYRRLWCDLEISEQTATIICHADEDVRIGDVLRAPYNLTIRRRETT